MEKIFENKVVIITGAASGIGQATAVAFAQRGAKVVVADYSDGNATVELVKNAGGQGIYVQCDVSDDKAVKAMVEKTVRTYGQIDYAVNNAGTEGEMMPFHEITDAIWNKTVNTDLKGVWLCMKYEIPYMLKRGKGAIVNTASIAGLVAFPNIAAYVAAKHGVIGLTKTAAVEYAKSGIRVNAICPGVIKTPMIERALHGDPQVEKMYAAGAPMNRLGKPEEMAETIVYLCSDAASYTTGHALVSDGGWVAQ